MALDRIRHGVKQTVTVVHQNVAVGPGGQAVVAGSVRGRGTRGKRWGRPQVWPRPPDGLRHDAARLLRPVTLARRAAHVSPAPVARGHTLGGSASLPGKLGEDEPKRDEQDEEAPGDAKAGHLASRDHPYQQIGVDDDPQRQRDQRQAEADRGEVDEAPGDATALGVAMMGGRRHYESHGEGQEHEGGKVQDPTAFAQLSKRWLKTATNWKPRIACTPGRTMRASSAACVPSSSSDSRCTSSIGPSINAPVNGAPPHGLPFDDNPSPRPSPGRELHTAPSVIAHGPAQTEMAVTGP
jgi:hypothetical protein